MVTLCLILVKCIENKERRSCTFTTNVNIATHKLILVVALDVNPP